MLIIIKTYVSNKSYLLSLPDALPIYLVDADVARHLGALAVDVAGVEGRDVRVGDGRVLLAELLAEELDRGLLLAAEEPEHEPERSEEHTSELQSRENLVCRLLLEKKK